MMWTTSKVCAGNRPKSSAVKTVVEAMTAPVVCGGVICGLLSTGTGQHACEGKWGVSTGKHRSRVAGIDGLFDWLGCNGTFLRLSLETKQGKDTDEQGFYEAATLAWYSLIKSSISFQSPAYFLFAASPVDSLNFANAFTRSARI